MLRKWMRGGGGLLLLLDIRTQVCGPQSRFMVQGLLKLECSLSYSLPEAMCCPVYMSSLPVDPVVGSVDVNCSIVLLIILSYSLSVLGHSCLQDSLCFTNVHLVVVLARNLCNIPNFVLLSWGLLFPSHKQLLQGMLRLHDSFCANRCTGVLQSPTEASGVGDIRRVFHLTPPSGAAAGPLL